MGGSNGRNQPADDERMRAYFLGELPAEESARFEEEVFQDEALAEQAFAIEGELIEHYVRGALTPGQHTRFEQYYLTTAARRERVKFAIAFQRQLAAAPTPRATTVEKKTAWWPPLFYTPRLAWALVLLIAVSFGLWWVIKSRISSPIDVSHNASPTPSAQVTPTTTATSAATTTPSVGQVSPTVTTSLPSALVATITLSPGTVRSSGQPLPTLKLPATANVVELKLLLSSDDFTSYRAELQTSDGATIWKRGSLKAQAGASGTPEVTVRIPARQLKRADYLLLLFGESQDRQGASPQVAAYSFRVLPD